VTVWEWVEVEHLEGEDVTELDGVPVSHGVNDPVKEEIGVEL